MIKIGDHTRHRVDGAIDGRQMRQKSAEELIQGSVSLNQSIAGKRACENAGSEERDKERLDSKMHGG